MKPNSAILFLMFFCFSVSHYSQDTIKNEKGEIIGIVVHTKCPKRPALDTLNYIKQFEVNKANYIGQPFSKLLNDMTKIQPKTVWSFSPHKNKNIRSHTHLNFCYMEHTFHDAITLYIEWETPLPTQETKMLSIANQYYFTNQEKLYYGSKIVKNIKVYR